MKPVECPVIASSDFVTQTPKAASGTPGHEPPSVRNLAMQIKETEDPAIVVCDFVICDVLSRSRPNFDDKQRFVCAPCGSSPQNIGLFELDSSQNAIYANFRSATMSIPSLEAVVRVISKARLKEFWIQSRYSDSESALKSWYTIVSSRDTDWHDNSDVKATFASASFVEECVVFNIGGNKYRLIAVINFRTHSVFVRSAITHKEYDKKDWIRDCGCKRQKLFKKK